jgi:hypothetical protein
MELAEAKDRLKAIEGALADTPFVEFHAFEREGRTLHIAITERLRKAARKEGVWRSREMLVTLKNAAYGFDERQARSVGGRDGIFLMDRTFRPANAMMRKLFDRFLDKPDAGSRSWPTQSVCRWPNCGRCGWCRTTCGCSGCWRGRMTEIGWSSWTATGPNSPGTPNL